MIVKNLELREILDVIDGVLIKGTENQTIHHVVNKTKKIKKDNTLLFHLYKKEVVRWNRLVKYTGLVIATDQPKQFQHIEDDVTLIKVEKLNQSYWKFIDYYRALFDLPVIGITGTSGKTTTKEMLKFILEKDHHVLATSKSNNASSLNLDYLMEFDEEIDVAVIEMGVAYPRDLIISGRHFKPSIGILLNIGVYHLQGLKTPEKYLEAKADLLKVVGLNGTVILNKDDNNIKKIDLSPFKGKILYVGFDKESHYRASNAKYTDGGMKYILSFQHSDYEVFVPGYGIHNVYNSLAALAGAHQVGLDLKEAITRLSNFQQLQEHLELLEGVNASTIIDDTWNTSPQSIEAALNVLRELANKKIKIAVIGNMPQLGSSIYAKEQYQNIGRKVVENKVDLLVVVSDDAKEIGNTAMKEGMDRHKIYFCENGDEVYKVIHPYLNKEAYLLLKVTHRVMVTPSFKSLKEKLMIRKDSF